MKKPKTFINENIKASEVLLITEDGEKHGLIDISSALDLAREKSLDLVQVSSSDQNPPVCKLLDFGKHVFQKKKNKPGTNKTKKSSKKEIKFRPSTDIGDYNVKIKKVKSFILDGDKTKRTVRFRGREILNSEMGLNLLKRVKEDLKEISQVEQEPSLEGRQLLMVLAPMKKGN